MCLCSTPENFNLVTHSQCTATTLSSGSHTLRPTIPSSPLCGNFQHLDPFCLIHSSPGLPSFPGQPGYHQESGTQKISDLQINPGSHLLIQLKESGALLEITDKDLLKVLSLQTGNPTRQQPEFSKEERKAEVLIVKSTFLRRISPAILASGLGGNGNPLHGPWSGHWTSSGLDPGTFFLQSFRA